jgi:putative nucleotidyltransferase with HDIG domain
MSLQPSLEDQELLADTLQRAVTVVSRRELVAETAAGAGYLAAAAALWAAAPPHHVGLLGPALCLAVFVLAMRVPFDTSFGFTVPTQLAFVPLLFALPPALVPLAVVLGLALARVPDLVRGSTRPSRLLAAAGNSWFAIGPVAVFVIAGVTPARAGAGLLLAALAAQFVGDFAVCALRVAIERGGSLRAQLRETWVYAVDAGLSGVGLVVAKAVPSHPLAPLTLVPLLGLFAVFARERHSRLEGLLELNNAYRGTALVLGDVVEADDGYTAEHSKGVVGLALELADQLSLGADRRRNLEFGALLHDVGKIAIPKEIINKPGKLDPHEWTIIKTHTVEGQRMLERVGGFMRQVGQIVRSHHERWDGAGYPDGLAGEQIPLEARIIACCDTWNAMRTDRPYRQALSAEVALAELAACAGSQLDPVIVEALVATLERSAAQPAVEHLSNSAAGGLMSAAATPIN